jgi:hypothetical protein
MNSAMNTAEIKENSLPPKTVEPPDWRFALLAAALLVAGAGAILFIFNPSQHGFYPICYFHAATGLNCPGCGSLRALHHLLHGHIVAAAHSNALLLLCLPFLAGSGARMLAQKWRRQPVTLLVRPAWLWMFLAAAIVFTVLRNLPAFAWLAP